MRDSAQMEELREELSWVKTKLRLMEEETATEPEDEETTEDKTLLRNILMDAAEALGERIQTCFAEADREPGADRRMAGLCQALGSVVNAYGRLI